MMDVALDLNVLTHAFFYFDLPVPYTVLNGEVHITPISVRDSEIFASSVGIINYDKNTVPDAKIIQMSYLQFVCDVLLKDEKSGKGNQQCLYNILYLCLGFEKPAVKYVSNKAILYDQSTGLEINAKEFDDIKKIIMYQNLPHFDDAYINPELKKAMNDVDELKNKNVDYPSLERRIAIITAHTGLPKREQEAMSYRSHSLLFEEVCGEVEFTTIRPAVLMSGSKAEFDHWIFKKPKNKFDGYTKSVDAYTRSMGGTKAVKSSDTSLGDSYMQQYNNFKQ